MKRIHRFIKHAPAISIGHPLYQYAPIDSHTYLIVASVDVTTGFGVATVLGVTDGSDEPSPRIFSVRGTAYAAYKAAAKALTALPCNAGRRRLISRR